MSDIQNKASCLLAFGQDYNAENILNAISIAKPMTDSSASLWLWVKGAYRDGSVSFAPYEVAKELKKLGWTVRNEIVWKCKAGDPAPENRLKRVHETVFHLTMGSYYYDRTISGTVMADEVARKLRNSYSKKISESTFLNEWEKGLALVALAEVSARMDRGEISDFRIVLRGLHKVDKWMSSKLDKVGFSVRVEKRHAPMVGDVWEEWAGETNAKVPLGMVARMVRLTCPRDGYVLDLFPELTTAKAVMACGCNYKSLFRTAEVPDSSAPVMAQEAEIATDKAEEPAGNAVDNPETPQSAGLQASGVEQ